MMKMILLVKFLMLPKRFQKIAKQFISYLEHNLQEIDTYYEEYRYGLKPGFSIFSFKSNKKLSTDQVCNKIQEKLKDISNKEEKQPAIKNIIYNNSENFKEEKITEYSFYYSKKYS